METSKVTSKFQTTIPHPIRAFLNIRKGDAVAFRIEGDKVVLSRAAPVDWQFLKSVESALSEWNSAEDDDAFRDL